MSSSWTSADRHTHALCVSGDAVCVMWSARNMSVYMKHSTKPTTDFHEIRY